MSWNVSVASVTAPTIQLGDFNLQTDAGTGAVLVKPINAPPEQAPAPVAKPASLVLDTSGLSIVPSAEFGGTVMLNALLDALLGVEINIAGMDIPMSFSSLLTRVLGRVSAAEASIADVSGYAHAAVATLEGVDAVLTATDAVHDLGIANAAAEAVAASLAAAQAAADLVLNALNDSSTAASVSALSAAVEDLSGNVRGRLDALENAPGFDATALEAAIADVSGYAHTAVAALEAADSAASGRLDSLETSATGAASRLDAVESALPTKVAQADYDVAIASATAAIAAAQASADGAASSAQAAQLTADAAATAAADVSGALVTKEDKGLRSDVAIYDLVLDTVGIEGMQSGVPWATIVAKSAEGKLVRISTVQETEINIVGVPPAPTTNSGLYARFLVECPGGIKLTFGDTEVARFAKGESYIMKEVAGAWAFVAGA